MSHSVCREYEACFEALFDGSIGDLERKALDRHVQSCEACGAEYAWLKETMTGFESIGKRAADQVPPVDLVGGVMAAVDRMKATTPNVTRIGTEPKRTAPHVQPRHRVGLWFGWAGLAAAATLIVMLWLSGYRLNRPEERTRVAINVSPEAPGPNGASPDPTFKPIARTIEEQLKEIDRRRGDAGLQLNIEKAPRVDGIQAVVPVSLDDVLATRRESSTDPEARLQLAEWASLTPEQARDIINSEDASIEAKVGASQALPAIEAQSVLEAAVEAEPDNPYYHYELAQAYDAEPSMQDKASAEYAAAAALDPQNGLADYQLASAAAESGDAVAAAAALEQASDSSYVTGYPSDSAACLEQALMATGLDATTARVLVALTAGTEQYVEIFELGADLIGWGLGLEAQGQTELAQNVYEATLALGEQAAEGSTYSNEQLAGLDVEREAVVNLANLYEQNGLTEEAEQLSEIVEQLDSGYNDLLGFFSQVNDFFQSADASLFEAASNLIVSNGDIGLLDFIFGATSGTNSGQ